MSFAVAFARTRLAALLVRLIVVPKLRPHYHPHTAGCVDHLAGIHELLPQPSEVLYITLLRDPVTRTTSGLNYNRVVKANGGQIGELP